MGSIIAFAGETVPYGYLECNGALLRRTTYAGLFDAIGTTWGFTSRSDFKVPNFTEAERFLRSRSESLPVGTLQGDAIRNITGTFNPWAYNTEIGSTGVFKDGVIGGKCFNVAAQANGQLVEFDVSRVHPIADEVRPKSAVVMYCIKVLDSVIDPEQILASSVLSEIANKADRNEIKELAGTRLWVSGEYTPILNKPTIVNHLLMNTSVDTGGIMFVEPIDPLRCRCDVILKCEVAQGGYSKGETIHAGWMSTVGASAGYSPHVYLTSTTIQTNTGSAGLYAFNKTNGSAFAVTLANWRYIFRIWY